MTFEQGINDANIITGTLTSSIGVVVASSIAMIGTGSIKVGVLRPSIEVPRWGVIIILPRLLPLIRVMIGPAVPVTPALASISLIGLIVVTPAPLMGLVILTLFLIIRVYVF